MAKVKRTGYTFFLLLTIALVVAAVVTFLPHISEHEPCLLGYKAWCSFTPVSTIICLALAGTVCVTRVRFFTRSE